MTHGLLGAHVAFEGAFGDVFSAVGIYGYLNKHGRSCRLFLITL